MMCLRKITAVSLAFSLMAIQGCSKLENTQTLNELNLYHKNITYKRLRTSIKGREFGIMGNIVRKILFSIFRAPLIGEKISRLLSRFFMLELIVMKNDKLFKFKY